MTGGDRAWKALLTDRRLVLVAALVAASAAGFTIGCLFTRLMTDSVTAQLIAALTGAVLAPAVRWESIDTSDSADDRKSLADVWGGVLITYGLGILLFPSTCPAAADVLQKHIPPFFYYAVGISGAIAVCVFVGMMWLKILKPLAEAESRTNERD